MPVPIVIPQAGESVTSGVLSRWLKNEGEFVKRDEEVLELETDKVTMPVPSPAAGVLSHNVKAGTTVNIGQNVGSIDEKATASVGNSATANKPAAVAESKPTAHVVTSATDVRATPLAKKLADERGVDLSKLTGSGAGGRIREQDVLGAGGSPAGSTPLWGVLPTSNGMNQSNQIHAPEGRATTERATSRERMTPLRQRIAQRLVQAQHTAAMLTTFNECDMGAVMELRKAYKDEFEKKHGVGLGFMGFFVKAVVNALQQFPLVNAFIVDDAGQPAIEKHDYCDIAVAVSTPKGLVVPVLRGCEKRSIASIESGIKDMAGKARDGKLTLEEMQGGTFTITNGGVFGSLMSTPILNPPQSAILGMHTIKNRPMEWPVGSGTVAVRPMMYLALSYDHRIIDGSEAVQFLVKVKQATEDPQRLLLAM